MPAEQEQTLTIQQAIDLAVQHHNAGDLPKAEGIYQQILQADPNQPVALHLLGVIAQQVGKNDIAVDLITKAITIKPDYAEAHYNLGNTLQELGQLDEGVSSYNKAIDIKPDYLEAHYNLGNIFRNLGMLDEAKIHYNKAIYIKPDYYDAHNNLGLTLQDLGKIDEAMKSFNKILVIKPNYFMAYYNLGNIYRDFRQLDEAVINYNKAITIKPDYAEAHNNLGAALGELEQLEKAVTSYNKAITIKPDFAEAHNNLGAALGDLGQLDEAIYSYNKAIAIKPDYAEAHYNLGNVLQSQDNVDGAIKQLDLALSYKPEKSGWLIRKALLLPIIHYSEEDIFTIREKLCVSIRELKKKNLVVNDPTIDIGVSNFYLAYHSQNNRIILEDIAHLHLSACPKLSYEAEHCSLKNHQKVGRLKIGILSSYFRNHTIGKLYKGVIEHLSKDKFEIVIIKPPQKTDKMSEAIFRAAEKTVPLCKNLDQDWKTIADEELDVLFYLDIGMDPYTYFLSFARLAPVQAVTIGHAETSGVPNIDYFISSKLTEPINADEHYSEELIRLNLLPTYYYRPKVPIQQFKPFDYGLPENKNLYLYPQTLFKLHPRLDVTFGEILRRDTEGRLILIDDHVDGHWNKLLVDRLQRSCFDVVDRVVFVPHMPLEKFFALSLLADAVLDNPFLSGTNSGLEMLSLGAPIVAWPGAYCSGNCVTACYKQMGLDDLIAQDEESFINLTLRLAQDQKFKHQMRSDIKANSHKLYERMEVVREMETFFIEAHKCSQNGEVLNNDKLKVILENN
jgi:protein O-GlcNAc transferase